VATSCARPEPNYTIEPQPQRPQIIIIRLDAIYTILHRQATNASSHNISTLKGPSLNRDKTANQISLSDQPMPCKLTLCMIPHHGMACQTPAAPGGRMAAS
jgi:hypothetical protein